VTTQAVIVVLVGLTAGYLADMVMKHRGHGMTGDVLLGIGGGLAGGTVLNVVANAPGREWFPLIATAFAGAILLIAAQRMFWQARD
jgi:uncharacterized membrane protein YeaQ/YmgE (transglycosylase-associated protein family)